MRIRKIFLMLVIIALSTKINCFAEIDNIAMVTIDVWDSKGNIRTQQELPEVTVGDCFLKDSDIEIPLDEAYVTTKYYTSKSTMEDLDEETKNLIFDNMSDEEFVSIITLRCQNEENPYPDIKPTEIRYSMWESVGSLTEQGERLGKDYRLYHLKDGLMREMELTYSDILKARFSIDMLGCYVFYYNPHVYSFDFYDDYPSNNTAVIHKAENLKRYDEVIFPEAPRKEGFIFTGWKQEIRRGGYVSYLYIDQFPVPLQAYMNSYVYASWCQEDEYTPLEVIIDSDKITKGKEDGAEIILALSEGKFDEVIDGNIEEDWKIVGNDELSIADVERVDDTTVKLTLLGNSSDKYKTGEIQVEFNSEFYISCEDFGDNWVVHEIADIQLDENGIKKAMFISDNSITLEKQKKSGNGGGVEKHTITFETNGGEEVQSVRVANGHSLSEPERVLKEGYVFAGWYTDEELTIPYDFENSVTEALTLYAAWEKPELKEPDNKQIILPIRFIEKAIELLKAIMN